MVREQVEVALDGIGLDRLEVVAGGLVEQRPECEGHALVRHLAGHDVLEDVRLVVLPVEPDEVDGAQRAEVIAHLVQRSELRVYGRQRGREEGPPHDARHL